MRNTAATSYKSLNEQPTFDNVSAQTDNAARFYSSYELTNAPSQNSTLLLNRPETNNRSFNESPALDDREYDSPNSVTPVLPFHDNSLFYNSQYDPSSQFQRQDNSTYQNRSKAYQIYHGPSRFLPLHPDLVVKKFISLKTPSKMSTLVVKLAHESFLAK